MRKSGVITQKHKRNFVQWGGASPANSVRYAGQDAQYVFVDGVSVPVGNVDPISAPDKRSARQTKTISRSILPPDLATVDLVMSEKRGAIPRQLQAITYPLNLYEMTGDCQDLANFLGGWSDYILVYSRGEVTSKDLGARSARDGDAPIEDRLALTLSDAYPIGEIRFTPSTTDDSAFVGAAYAIPASCRCSDGTKWLYAVTADGDVHFTTDGGQTWIIYPVALSGGDVQILSILLVSNSLILGSDGGHYYAEIDTYTGTPGTFTRVDDGMSIFRLFALSPREIFAVGQSANAAYALAKATNPSSAFTQLQSGSGYLFGLHGAGDCVIAVGYQSDFASIGLLSHNRGATWDALSFADFNFAYCVNVRSSRHWWVGTLSEGLWYTLDGGATWEEKVLPGGIVGVGDLAFVSDEVGFATGGVYTVSTAFFTGASVTGSNINDSGVIAWTVPTHAEVLNGVSIPNNTQGADANHNLSPGSTARITDILAVTIDANTDIPSDALITGYMITIRRGNPTPGSTSTTHDHTVQLLLDGALHGDNQSAGALWSNGVWEVKTFGGNGSMMGASLTPAMIRAGRVGVGLKVTMVRNSGFIYHAYVDAIQLTVYYVSPTGASYIATTYDGGNTWTQSAPRVDSADLIARNEFINRIATPDTGASIAANNIALACTTTAGGALELGIAGVV